MVLDADVNHHIFVDKVGFNLAKTRRHGRNIIGQQETSPQIYGQMIKTDLIQINVVCYGFLFI